MLALLFPGQGSQRPQMGVPWRDHPAWEVVDRLAEATGRDLAGSPARRRRRHPQGHPQRPAGRLRPQPGHPGSRRAGLASPARRSGPWPATAWASTPPWSRPESLTPEEGARLVAARGEAMQAAADAEPGTMAAVLGLDP